MAEVSAVGAKKSGLEYIIKAEESKRGVTKSETRDTSSETGVMISMEGATSSNTSNTIDMDATKGAKGLNFTYPQREWNTCTGTMCPFGWIHIAGDEKKIAEIEALGDITNAADAKTWSKLKFDPRRYSLETLLKVGDLIGKNALGYLDPNKFKSGAIDENLVKLKKWYRVRGLSSMSQDSEDGNMPVGRNAAIPIRQPNPPPNQEDQKDAGFRLMAVRQPKPPPRSLKEQYEQGFMQYPTRQPFGPPDPNEETSFGTLSREWPGFSPYNPIRQPRPPPKDLRAQADTGFAKHPTRQPIATPEADTISGKVDIGFRHRFSFAVPTPIRQPVPAPTRGKIHVVAANFKHFLEKHQSPTHQRVTAGGRIVPFNPDARPPQFDLQKLSKEGTVAKVDCTSNGSVHSIRDPQDPVAATPQHAIGQNSAFNGPAGQAGTNNHQQVDSQSMSNGSQQTFQNQGHDTAQLGSHSMVSTGQYVFHTQGMGAAAQVGIPIAFQNQEIATAQLGNPAHTISGNAQPMPLSAAIPFHNQGIGSLPQMGQALPQMGQALPLYNQPMYCPGLGYFYPKTPQELAAYQQAMVRMALPQGPMVAYNVPAAANSVFVGGNQPYAANTAMAVHQYPIGATMKNDLRQVTQDIATLEQYIKTVGLEIQKTESELKLLDGQRSYFDDQLRNGEKDGFIAKRRAIVTKRSELRQHHRYLEEIANGKYPQPLPEPMRQLDQYSGGSSQGYSQNANMFVPQVFAQQSASVPLGFGSINNLGVAQDFRNQNLEQPGNQFTGLPASYVASQLALGRSHNDISPQKSPKTTHQHSGAFGGQISASHQLNVQAPEWTPNGSNGKGRNSARGSAQKDRHDRRSSSEEIKKEWEHVSHAEASTSSGHLGANLESVAAVSNEVIRQVFEAIRSAGPADRLITIRIGGDREVAIQGGSGGMSGPQLQSSPYIHGNTDTNGLSRARTSSAAATQHSSPSRNTNNQVDDMVRAQISRAPNISGISPFGCGSDSVLPHGMPAASSGPSTPPRSQDPYRHKVGSSVASTNVNAQGYLGQIDGAADHLGPMSSKSKNHSVAKKEDKCSATDPQKISATKVNQSQPYGRLTRAPAESRDVRNFFKLIRQEEDPIIAKYKAENPM